MSYVLYLKSNIAILWLHHIFWKYSTCDDETDATHARHGKTIASISLNDSPNRGDLHNLSHLLIFRTLASYIVSAETAVIL